MSAKQIYKQLLRTTRKTFKNEPIVLQQAKIEIKNNFLKNKDLTDGKKIKEMLKIAVQTNEIIKKNVVYGEYKEGKYELQVNEDTEINDNDRIRQSQLERDPSASVGCCQGTKCQ
ncbi:Mitochondrial zinc maintenance protein 1, mitochondrial [Boothiomyces sp. JEL0838]|nr:Mitochondrial zinc maintenance protein 1, mitochondrial [Boothiomyces sp. JEL0838]